MRGIVLPAADSATVRSAWRTRHIVLVGLPGAGKSTVAPGLAAALGRPFHDIDAEIVRRTGRSIAELFAANGESGFRVMESEVTRELLSGPPAVIATGGGWVLTDSNWAAAANAAVVVHLGVTPATAARRLGAASRSRPLLNAADPGVRIREIEAARRERYARAAVVLDTELLDSQEVVQEIRALIERSARTAE